MNFSSPEPWEAPGGSASPFVPAGLARGPQSMPITESFVATNRSASQTDTGADTTRMGLNGALQALLAALPANKVSENQRRITAQSKEAEAEASLSALKQAMAQVNQKRRNAEHVGINSMPAPGRSGSTPIDLATRRFAATGLLDSAGTPFGIGQAANWAGDLPELQRPGTSTLTSVTPSVTNSRNTTGLRSELRALQDGLFQLRQAISARRNRFSRMRGVSGILEGAPTPPLISQDQVKMQLSQSAQHSRIPSQNPPIALKGPPAILQIDEDALSQTDSATPSNLLQAQILSALQGMTDRLQRLENQRQLPSPPEEFPLEMPNLGRQPPPQESQQPTPEENHVTLACDSVLQAELCDERFKRLRLEAIIKALGIRYGIDTDVLVTFAPLAARTGQEQAASEFDPQTIDSMTHAELRAMIEMLSVRTKEALKTQVMTKSRLVQLTGALRTIHDLSARIVELEDRLLDRPPSGTKTKTEFVETISKMALRIRSQNLRLRSMKEELDTMRAACSSAYFTCHGVTSDTLSKFILAAEAKQAADTTATSPESSANASPGSKSPSRSTAGRPPGTGKRLAEGAPITPPRLSPARQTLVSPSSSIAEQLDSVTSVVPTAADADYVPFPNDPVDAAVAAFSNGRLNKVLFTRLRLGFYLFGRLHVHIGLSSSSRQALVFYGDRKYSIKKFVRIYEDAEFIHLQHRTLVRQAGPNVISSIGTSVKLPGTLPGACPELVAGQNENYKQKHRQWEPSTSPKRPTEDSTIASSGGLRGPNISHASSRSQQQSLLPLNVPSARKSPLITGAPAPTDAPILVQQRSDEFMMGTPEVAGRFRPTIPPTAGWKQSPPTTAANFRKLSASQPPADRHQLSTDLAPTSRGYSGTRMQTQPPPPAGSSPSNHRQALPPFPAVMEMQRVALPDSVVGGPVPSRGLPPPVSHVPSGGIPHPAASYPAMPKYPAPVPGGVDLQPHVAAAGLPQFHLPPRIPAQLVTQAQQQMGQTQHPPPPLYNSMRLINAHGYATQSPGDRQPRLPPPTMSVAPPADVGSGLPQLQGPHVAQSRTNYVFSGTPLHGSPQEKRPRDHQHGYHYQTT